MKIEISNGNFIATLRSKGAELTSLKSASGEEFIWEGNPDYWGKHSPVLFPIVGTLKNNTYRYNGKEYFMTRHGFARDNDFIVKQTTKSNVVFTLSQNIGTLSSYPFCFILELEYNLDENGLEVIYTVKNNDSKVMPFSLGAHPAFAMPGNFEDYSLSFNRDQVLLSSQLENDLLSDTMKEIPLHDGLLPLNYSLFDNDALIFRRLKSNRVEILKRGNPYLRVIFPDFQHLGIWTKKDAPFLCIEPWQGYSDHHNTHGNIMEKDGIIKLPPNEIYRLRFKIEILH